MIRVLGTDSQLDPDTNVELVTGRIWQNTMIYTKSPTGMDFGYQPIVAPQTVAVLDNLLLQEIPKIETNGLIWDGLDAYAAMLRAMTV